MAVQDRTRLIGLTHKLIFKREADASLLILVKKKLGFFLSWRVFVHFLLTRHRTCRWRVSWLFARISLQGDGEGIDE